MDARITAFHQAAARWARGYFLSEVDFLSLIRSTRIDALTYTRLRARGKTRRIVERFGQTDEPGRPAAPVRIEDFDPWAETSASLHTKTRQIVVCGSCSGEKRVVCSTCGGNTRVRCPSCIAGVQLSLRTGKPINCKSCRGKGERSCPSCRNGKVTCSRCDGKGRLLRFLALEEQSLNLVFDSPANALAQSISATSFDQPADTLPVIPSRTWSGEPSASPDEVAACEAVLLLNQRIDPRHDRIEKIDFQSFAAESAVIDFELLCRRASVEVRTWDQAVVPSPASSWPLRRRLRFMGIGSGLAFLAGMLVAGWYGGRHSYFAASCHHGLLMAMALLLGMALLWPLSQFGLVAAATPRRWSWLPVTLVAVAQVAIAATGYPSLRQATRLAEAGDGAAAIREAAACADLRRDERACAELHDRLRLAEAQATSLTEEAWRAAADRYYSEAIRRRAEDHARELTVATALALEAENRFEDLDALIGQVGADRLQADRTFADLLVRLHRRKLTQCFPRFGTACARAALANAANAGIAEEDLEATRREGRALVLTALGASLRQLRAARPPNERLTACAEIAAPLAFLEVVAPDGRLRDEVRAKCRDAKADLEEAERRAKHREEEIAARRRASWATAPLLCRDGALSPTCTCGGPRRGCCSHHGGVAGCSQ